MDVLLVTLSAARGEQLSLRVEDADEGLRCRVLCDGAAALHALRVLHPAAVLLEECLPGLDGPALLAELWRAPPCPAPKVLYRGDPCYPVDAAAPSRAGAAELVPLLLALLQSKALPVLCARLLPPLTAQAEALLEELRMKPGLKARAFLPRAVALCAACPALLRDVTGRLYPYLAAETALTPCAVERDMRSAVESLWSSGDLAALDRRFGHTVDPEKGRPTNRAFLATLAETLNGCLWAAK